MFKPIDTEKVVRHIEVKAYVDDFHAKCANVAELAALSAMGQHDVDLYGPSDKKPENKTSVDRVQDDTFFHCNTGRLKLRNSGHFHDLIFYRRENDYGPSESFYQSARAKNPGALRSSLVSAFGEAGRVKKYRRIFRVGCSVIHLDRVGGLGDFIEIKVKLGTYGPFSMSAEKGAQIVQNLMKTFEVDLFQLVDGAYVDLLNERNNNFVET